MMNEHLGTHFLIPAREHRNNTARLKGIFLLDCIWSRWDVLPVWPCNVRTKMLRGHISNPSCANNYQWITFIWLKAKLEVKSIQKSTFGNIHENEGHMRKFYVDFYADEVLQILIPDKSIIVPFVTSEKRRTRLFWNSTYVGISLFVFWEWKDNGWLDRRFESCFIRSHKNMVRFDIESPRDELTAWGYHKNFYNISFSQNNRVTKDEKRQAVRITTGSLKRCQARRKQRRLNHRCHGTRRKNITYRARKK